MATKQISIAADCTVGSQDENTLLGLYFPPCLLFFIWKWVLVIESHLPTAGTRGWFTPPLTCIPYDTWLHPWQWEEVTCAPWPGTHLVPQVTSSLLVARRLTTRCKAVCHEPWKTGVFPVRISQLTGLSPLSQESFLPFAFSLLLFWFVSFIDIELIQILLLQLLKCWY